MKSAVLSAVMLIAVTGPCSSVVDRSELIRLENQARALAITAGCSSVDQCRSAPVGSKSCGGPRYYLPYCSLTTDSAALFRTLDELATKERAYNRERGIVSTCEFIGPPALTLSGGECKAAQ